MELFELGIKQAQEGLAKGEFSSVELTQAIIDRYHAKNGEIGAYLTFDEEACEGESEGRPDRNQGPDQRQGATVHVRVEDPEGLRFAL